MDRRVQKLSENLNPVYAAEVVLNPVYVAAVVLLWYFIGAGSFSEFKDFNIGKTLFFILY